MPGNYCGQTAELLARMYPDELADLFLALGADPKAIGPDGNTSLHNACLKGLVSLSAGLLQRGADSNARVRRACYRCTMLLSAGTAKSYDCCWRRVHVAASWNRVDVTKALLAGARVDARPTRRLQTFFGRRDTVVAETLKL